MTQNDTPSDKSCCNQAPRLSGAGSPMEMFPIYQEPADDAPCCGPSAGPPSNPHERPGYQLSSYVGNFIDTPAGPVPSVKTKLDHGDKWGTLRMRLGAGRNDYKVSPGLYAVGNPAPQSPVLVSANYKLSFDILRAQLSEVDGWILVLDTRGINVWCAAGKGTFGTQEIVRQVKRCQLSKVVDHRKLIVPQLGAVGVAAHEVRKACGFEVVWGPIQARDIKAFLAAGMEADAIMRRVTFALGERLILVPVELTLLRKYLLWILIAAAVLSGIGGHIFSLTAAWHRGLAAIGGLAAGVLAGAVLVPALLPWIPGRAFSVKGALLGLPLGIATAAAFAVGPNVGLWSGTALVLWAVSVSSFLAMNFTGSTPFTSPSGVEKEMRRAIPLQLAAVVLATGLWIGTGFGG